MPNQKDSSGERGIRADDATNDRDYRSDGTGKIGVTSDNQPDLVAPSRVNEGDHGSVGEAPMAGDMLNFDDEAMSGRSNSERTGGTWDSHGADSGRLAPPREIMSNRNGPSDPDRGDGSKSS